MAWIISRSQFLCCEHFCVQRRLPSWPSRASLLSSPPPPSEISVFFGTPDGTKTVPVPQASRSRIRTLTRFKQTRPHELNNSPERTSLGSRIPRNHLGILVLASHEQQVCVLAGVRWESVFTPLVQLTEELRLITAEEDRIGDALVNGIVATFGATIIAVPWYGFTPVIAACAGLVAACLAFDAVQKSFGK